MDSPLILFYKELKPDSEGRMLSEIWAWDADRLENKHDYIQWLFPLDEPSSANYKAPVLSKEDITAFRQTAILKNNLLKSFKLMLSFYGFEMKEQNEKIRITKSINFKERAANWLRKYNHNFLRLTRILKCLLLAGLPEYAHALFSALEELYNTDYTETIGKTTFNYWRKAVKS